MSTKPAEQPKPKYESAEQERTDRELCGRFAKGNIGGPGNPYNRQIAAFRKAIVNCKTPEQIQALASKIYDIAMEGDLAAAKLFLLYAVGKPTPAPDPDLQDIQEHQIYRATLPLKEEVAPLMAAGSAENLLGVLRTFRPVVGAIQQQQLMDAWRDLQPSEERKKREAKEEAEAARRLSSPGPVLPDGLEEKLWPTANGLIGELPSAINGYGDRPPTANGGNGKAKQKKKDKRAAAPSTNGRFQI